MLYKRKCNTRARKETAFAMHMFYSKVVLYYIHKQSELDWDNETIVDLPYLQVGTDSSKEFKSEFVH